MSIVGYIHMADMIVQGIDDETYRQLKIRAAKESLTLKAIMLKLISLYIHGKVKLV